MRFFIVSATLLFIALGIYGFLSNPQKKSKLCGNEVCDEVLFKTRVKRVMGINNDQHFLKLTDGAIIDVVAVKFSDRYDIMEGKIGDSRGFFYTGAIDMSPYAEFLRSAIVDKKEMQMISQDPSDFGTKRLIGVVHSELDLVRDFNAKATEVAREQGLPPPELLPVPQPVDDSGHGHSHGPGGHGHSHGGHGHSHEAVKAPEVTTTTPAPEAQPVINLNNVLGTPPTVEAIEEDLEKFIQEDEEKREKAEELINSEVVPEDPKPSDSTATQPVPVNPVPRVQKRKDSRRKVNTEKTALEEVFLVLFKRYIQSHKTFAHDEFFVYQLFSLITVLSFAVACLCRKILLLLKEVKSLKDELAGMSKPINEDRKPPSKKNNRRT